MVFAALLLLSSTKNRKKKYRVLSNFSTIVSYVIYVFILAQHRVLYCTGERGLDENHVLYVLQLLCESQQQFSWRQTHVKPTTVIQSLPAARRALVW